MKKCYLIGQNTLTNEQKGRATLQLEIHLENLIAGGYKYFSMGLQNDSDYLVAGIIAKFKARYKHIFLEAIMENPDILTEEVNDRKEAFSCCDGFGISSRTSVIDSSDTLIVIWDNKNSKDVYNALEYAKIQGKRVFHILI